MTTLILQGWVGYHTIYAPEREASRLAMHHAVLNNELQSGTAWENLGASTLSVRRLNVELAGVINRFTGVSIQRTYLITDTFFLFTTFLLVFAFISQMMPAQWGLVAILLYGSVLPATYFAHYFQPWDRLSLCSWLLFLILLRAGYFWSLLPILFVSITIKYDTLPLPILYWMATVEREHWRSALWRTALLGAVGLGTYFGLLLLYPTLSSAISIGEQVARNLEVIGRQGLRYAPFLTFTPILFFAALGIKSADRFIRSCALFAVMLFVPLFLRSNFVEVRAEMQCWILLLPAALLGLRRLIEGEE
jgi:hypothetical protein